MYFYPFDFVSAHLFLCNSFKCTFPMSKKVFFKADINRMGAKYRVLTTRNSIYFEPAGAK